MTLTTIAELLIGESQISPGGPVDLETAHGDEPLLWGLDLPAATVPDPDPILAETGLALAAAGPV